jgi:hypothetical protein
MEPKPSLHLGPRIASAVSMSPHNPGLIEATLLELPVPEIVNLDLDGALEAVLEEMRSVFDDPHDADSDVWEEISCVDLDDPFPMLEPVWLDAALH